MPITRTQRPIRKVLLIDQAKALLHVDPSVLADADLAALLAAVQTTAYNRIMKEACGRKVYSAKREDDVIPRLKNTVRTWCSADPHAVVCFAIEATRKGKAFESPIEWLK